jgi:hypothetical protein
MSTDLKSQIHTYGAQLVDSQTPITDADIADRTAVLLPVRSRGQRGLAVAAGAAVVTLIVIGAVAWLAPLDGDSRPADEPVVTTTLSALSLSADGGVTVRWIGRQADGRPPIRNIVSTSFGFLGTDFSRALWRSNDGVNWTPTLTDLSDISVASSGSMTLVSGVRDGSAVLLRSADDGTWSNIDISDIRSAPQNRDVIATTPSGLTWLGSQTGGAGSVLVVIDADRVTAVYAPPWDQEVCCGVTLAQVGDNVVAYQFDQNEPQFTHAWEYLGNGQWSDVTDVPLSTDHAVVGGTMLRFDHTNATCCGIPDSGETQWPLWSSNDGINWTEVGPISGHDVHTLHVIAGSSFWMYGPNLHGGGNDIEVVPGTTLGISVDGQHWHEIVVPEGIDETILRGPTGGVRAAGNMIFIPNRRSDRGLIWVGTIETS